MGKAHNLVLSQCAVCSKCTREEAKCVDRDMLAARKAKQAKEALAEKVDKSAHKDDPFDCDGRFSDKDELRRWEREWSKAKKIWCCKHMDKGCDEASDADEAAQDMVFRKKFDSAVVRHALSTDRVRLGAGKAWKQSRPSRQMQGA